MHGLRPANSPLQRLQARATLKPINFICIAPEAPDQPSLYRKPSPRYIQEMIAQHHLDPAQCAMVGDRASDIQAGLGAGVRAIAVCTGELTADAWQTLALPGAEIHADLAAFVATLA